MSAIRWPWADHLSRKEAAEVGAIEAEIKWLRARGLCADAMKLRRQRLVNRGTQRAINEAKRKGRPVRAYRKQEST